MWVPGKQIYYPGMPEQRAPGHAGVATSRWGNSPQEAFVGILNNAGKHQTAPRGPVRHRGFVVVVRNIQSLQAVQQWCLQQTWNDCLAARYRIDSGPVFGTLFAAFGEEADALPGPVKNGSVLYQPDSEWPKQIRSGLAKDLSEASGRLGDQGELPAETLLEPLGKMLAESAGLRLVLLAEVFGGSDPAEWEDAKKGLFPLLPERMGLVLAGAPDSFWLPEDDPHYMELDLDGMEPPGDAYAYAYQFGALTSDRPSPDDRLGVQRYADALAQFVLHPGTTALTVAIHGPWGKGKSTFMQLVQQSLVQQSFLPERIAEVRFGPDGQPWRPNQLGRRPWKRTLRSAQKRVVTVRFNAWRFQDSTQIWAGLASVITARLEAALPPWRRLLIPILQAWRTQRARLITELVLPAIVALLILVLAALGIPPLVSWLDSQLASNSLAKLLGAVVPAAGAAIASFWIVASQARRMLQPVSERVLAYIQRPDYREQMGYQNRVLDDVQFVRRRLCGDGTEPRIFIFIDDLDRCPTDTIMEILQAINLILGESDFYVFLGIDTEMIYRAIDARYAADGRPLPGRRFAETYLQKIVQLPFYLPETPDYQRASFIRDLFSEAARKSQSSRAATPDGLPGTTGSPDMPSAASANPLLFRWDQRALRDPEVAPPTPVQDTPFELEAFLDFLPYLRDNPREVKRLVNIHRFVKIILQGQGRPVPEEAQRKLVKWLIFCDRWPDLVDDALNYARDNPGSLSPIADFGKAGAVTEKFADNAGPEDILTADDLAPHGPLALAASISSLIAWHDTSRPRRGRAAATR